MEVVLIVAAACGLVGCFGSLVNVDLGLRRRFRLGSRASLR